MSRSIQKALVQHGVMSKFMTNHHSRYSPAAAASPASTPLDLRTSPAIRRTHCTTADSSDSSGGSPADSSPGSARASSTSPPPLSAFQRRRRLASDASLLGSTIAETPESEADTHPHHQPQSLHLPLLANRNGNGLRSDSVYESCKSYDAANDNDDDGAGAASGNCSPDAPVASSTTAGTESVGASALQNATPIRKILGMAIRASSFAERQAAPRPSCYEPSKSEDEAETAAETTEQQPVAPVLAADRGKVQATSASNDNVTPMKQPADRWDDDGDEPDVWFTPPVKLHKAASFPVRHLATASFDRDASYAESALAHRSSESGEENVFSSTKHGNLSGAATPPTNASGAGQLRSARSELSAFYMREKFLARPSPVRSVKKRRAIGGTPKFKKPTVPEKTVDGSGIWSRVTSGLRRLASFGQQPAAAAEATPSPPAPRRQHQPGHATTDVGLLKMCATFAGRSSSSSIGGGMAGDVTEVVQTVVMRTVSSSTVASTEMAIVAMTHGKRRRTLTNSASGMSPTGADRSAATINRISGRPPLKRMRRIGWVDRVSPV